MNSEKRNTYYAIPALSSTTGPPVLPPRNYFAPIDPPVAAAATPGEVMASIEGVTGANYHTGVLQGNFPFDTKDAS